MNISCIPANQTVRRAICLALLLTGWSLRAPAAEFHVSPTGDDANPGTAARPFRTLEAARDAVRRATPVGGHTVWLQPGNYRLTRTFELGPADSGAPGRPNVYAARKPDTVFLEGGIRLPASVVTPITDPALRSRLIESARDQIRQIDLRGLGITDYGELGHRGFRRAYRPAPMELFIDHEPMLIARWPNAGEPHILMGKVIEKGSEPRVGDYSLKPGTFKYVTPRAERWTQADDLYISGFFAYGYADDTMKVARIDVENGTITTELPHLYGFRNQKYTKWFALNLIEEIDQPGEYCIDRRRGVLLFYPAAGFNERSLVQLSMLEEVMVAMEDCSHVHWRNITFENSRGSAVYIEKGDSNQFAGCTFRNLGILAVQIGKGIEPYPLGQHDACGNKADGKEGVPVSRIVGSWHEYIYKHTAWNREGGTHHRILSCDIRNTGGGGVLLGGGDRKTLTPGNNSVENCDISRVNRLDRTYKAPVNVDGVGNRIVHNAIHDVEGMGIYLHGNDHLIAFNEIYRVLTDMSDQGAIYSGRDPSESGNVIRHNFFHHVEDHHPGGHGVQAIFFDDYGSTTATVFGNVFYKAGNTGVVKFFRGGESPIINNIVIDCPRLLQAQSCDPKKFLDWMHHDPLAQSRLRQEVDILAPPYSVKYPRLVALYKGERTLGHPMERNYVVNGDHSEFVDAAALDFRLKKDSTVFTEIPGFEPIPFEKIGLYRDKWRRDLNPRSR